MLLLDIMTFTMFLALVISCAISNHPLGCGCWLCCCGQKLIYKLNEVPGYPETKPERG